IVAEAHMLRFFPNPGELLLHAPRGLSLKCMKEQPRLTVDRFLNSGPDEGIVEYEIVKLDRLAFIGQQLMEVGGRKQKYHARLDPEWLPVHDMRAGSRDDASHFEKIMPVGGDFIIIAYEMFKHSVRRRQIQIVAAKQPLRRSVTHPLSPPVRPVLI